MRFIKKHAIFSIIFLLLVGQLLHLTLTHQAISWLNISDDSFMIALFFLIVGLGIWIISAGTFDFIARSFRFHRKKEKSVTDETKTRKPSEIYLFQHRPWFVIGLFFLVISIMCYLIIKFF